MPEKDLISLEQAQIAAERFLEERLKGIKNLSIQKIQLTSVENIVVYDVEGVASTGGSIFAKKVETPFKIQVAAREGAVVGYQM